MLKKLFLLFLSTIFLHTILYAKEISIDQVITQSKKEKKPIILYLHRTGCPYCERLEEFTFDDGDIEEYMKKYFIFEEFNGAHTKDVISYKQNKYTNKQFALTLGYNFYPVTLFMDENGAIVYRALGYIEDTKFMLILEYVKTKQYKKIDFETFKQKKVKTDHE